MAASKKPKPDLYWQVIQPIWKKVSIYDDPEDFLKQFGKLKPALGHLLAIQWCYSEICNGGFDQFFWNSTGVLAPEAADGFRAIGLSDGGKLIERAMKLFGTSYPRKRAVRQYLLRTMGNDVFDKISDKFFGCLDDKNKPLHHSRFCRLANAYASKWAI